MVAILWLPARIARAASGGLQRCFCLAWTRAHLGRQAVPLDNQILGLIDFQGTRRVRLGRNCRIHKRVSLETQDDGVIIISDNVVISQGATIVAHERVVIESYAMIGEYCSIRDQDHRFDVSGPVRISGFITAPITIGADAWIGRGCAILKGVTVGARAVIGAGSVLTKSVPPAEVWVGVPARFLRKRD